MATRRTIRRGNQEAAAPQLRPSFARTLLEQYECGPIAFSGVPDAFYERRLVFDHVVRLDQADPRQRFEAVARRCATCSRSAG